MTLLSPQYLYQYFMLNLYKKSNRFASLRLKNSGFDVWLMTVVTPTHPAGAGRVPLLCSSAWARCSVGAENRGGKTCTHMWDVMQQGRRAGAVDGGAWGGGGAEGFWLCIVFNRWDSGKGRAAGRWGRVCVSVCVCWARSAGCCRGVFFLSVAEQYTPCTPSLHPPVLAASQTLTKITGHAPLFMRWLSLSSSSISPDPFRSAVWFLPPFLFLSTLPPVSFWFLVCLMFLEWSWLLTGPVALSPSFPGSRTATWKSAYLPCGCFRFAFNLCFAPPKNWDTLEGKEEKTQKYSNWFD